MIINIFDYKFKNEDLIELFISKFLKNNNYIALYKASRLFNAMNKVYIEKNLNKKLTDKEYIDFKKDIKYLVDLGNSALQEDLGA